jgi:DNA-binding transcriptional LysR family regulator
MPRADLDNLRASLAVAARAELHARRCRLDVSPSALSNTICGLEERLRFGSSRRPPRRVAPSGSGTRLVLTLGPNFDEIGAEPGPHQIRPISGVARQEHFGGAPLRNRSCFVMELATA